MRLPDESAVFTKVERRGRKGNCPMCLPFMNIRRRTHVREAQISLEIKVKSGEAMRVKPAEANLEFLNHQEVEI